MFFWAAALDAFQSKNIWNAALWLAVGAVFLFGDNVKGKLRAS